MKPKPTLSIPTAAEIPALEDRLAIITAEIAALEAEEKTIKARLGAYAFEHPDLHEPLKDEKREGRKLALPQGRVEVILQSDLIIGTFPDKGPKHKELLSVLCEEYSEEEAPKVLKRFFSAPAKWENLFDNGVKFRLSVAERLPKSIGAKFISSCTQVDKFGVKKNNTTFDIKPTAKVEKGAE